MTALALFFNQERTRAQLDELKSFAEKETKRYDTVVKCMRYSHFKDVFPLKASKQSNRLPLSPFFLLQVFLAPLAWERYS